MNGRRRSRSSPSLSPNPKPSSRWPRPKLPNRHRRHHRRHHHRHCLQQQATAQHLTIYHGFKNAEKIRLDQPNAEDEPSPGAFAGAKSEFVPPAN